MKQNINIFQLYGTTVMCLCLAFLGPTSKIYLWVFACLTNFVGSPIWPAGIAWMDCYMEVTGFTMMLLNTGSSTGQLLFQYLTGRSRDIVV